MHSQKMYVLVKLLGLSKKKTCWVNHSHRVSLGHCPSKALQTTAPEPQASGGHNNTACPTVRLHYADDQLQMSHHDFNPMGSTESLHHNINETQSMEVWLQLQQRYNNIHCWGLPYIVFLFFLNNVNSFSILYVVHNVKIYTKLWETITEEREWELWHICRPMLVW